MGQRLKQTNMRKQLLQFVATLSILLIGLMVLGLVLNQLAINSGFIVQANYDEERIISAESAILEAKQVTPDLIPDGIPYIVLKKNTLQRLQGNMDEADISEAKKVLHDRVTYQGQTVYRVMERAEEMVIVQYNLRPRFASPLLRELLPDFEQTVILIWIALMILTVLLVTKRFSSRLQQNFTRIQQVTQRIQNQDLNLGEERSEIKEFDDVLQSLLQMGKELEKSLQAQWKLEQRKRDQIGALAHDIKIPVTIIKGNAELLSLSEQSEEQATYTQYIVNASEKIEQYVGLLIHLSKTEQNMTLRKTLVPISEFMTELYQEICGYIGPRSIELDMRVEKLAFFQASFDKSLLHRALMNILSNAADYTPDEGNIIIECKMVDDSLYFCVTDSGRGFTSEELEFAAELFYMGDKSRSSKGHYGMGLTFASNVVKLHNGKITFQNSKQTGGARVELSIPRQ